MARNVEIKARVKGPGELRRRVAAAADGPPRILEQTDTFFRVPRGRLKLRVRTGAPAELIYYQRADTKEPSESDYEKVEVADAAALRALLASAFGTRGEVVKRRTLYHVGRTRVHLDEVVGLGDFLELEVQLAAGESADDGAAEARRLMELFGVRAEALVAEAYVDLLAR